MTLIVSKVTANVTKLTALPSICHLVDKPQKRDRAPRGQKESPEQPPEETPEGRHQNKKATGQRSRLATGTTHTPKPEVPDPVLGLDPEPVRGAQVPGPEVEGAAAQNAPGTTRSIINRIANHRRWDRLFTLGLSLFVRRAVPTVRYPLPHVSCLVQRSEWPSSLRLARDRFGPRIWGILIEHRMLTIGRWLASPRILLSIGSSRCLFPLRFCRQVSSYRAAVRSRFVPIHGLHWQIFALVVSLMVRVQNQMLSDGKIVITSSVSWRLAN